ncbi:carboxypeptidase regulatory-like domain-containing protein [Archangium violaceum]|uniref:carboxypeptidase-like regulatory domain-containing protein n=1 Tax=Archangium violaceum TaxID=83451 RepID=UPI00193C3D44|nr:carboxypeptidase-like regulatory domain-containing protein [Archangium violaceum]QRK12741.1 carboxypeptidase regulatory-like domain-containing protein [Archangium violaceum]
MRNPRALLLTLLGLTGCLPIPNRVPLHPDIQGRVIAQSDGRPITGAEIVMEIHSDREASFRTSTNETGEFHFARRTQLRAWVRLADAPMCSTRLTISVPGHEPWSCQWMSNPSSSWSGVEAIRGLVD